MNKGVNISNKTIKLTLKVAKTAQSLKRGIIQSNLKSELWDSAYKVNKWSWISVWSFKAILSEKNPCMQRFNRQRRRRRQRRGDNIKPPYFINKQAKYEKF